MGSHSNETMAHDFFYQCVNNGVTKRYESSRISYRADEHGFRCFSYSTCIAKVIPAKGFDRKDVRTDNVKSGITLVSMYSLTNSTAKHIGYVCEASPFEVIGVPILMGETDVIPGSLAEEMLETLRDLSGKLSQRKNRSAFLRILDTRKSMLELACDEWAKPFRRKAFDRFEAMRGELDAIAAVLAAKNRKRAATLAKKTRKKHEQERKFLEKTLIARTGQDYLDFLRAVFAPGGDADQRYRFSTDEIRLVRKALLVDSYRTAYVWTDGDEVRTSKGVSVPIREVRVALKAWAAGRDMRTCKIGEYQIVKYEGDTIQIGCHHIPRTNILELYSAVIGKPFERKGSECGR